MVPSLEIREHAAKPKMQNDDLILFDARGNKVSKDGHVYTFAASTGRVRAAIDAAIVEHFDKDHTGVPIKESERSELVRLICHHLDLAYDLDETERLKRRGLCP